MLNFFKRRAAAPGDDLRYEDIPNKQDRAVEAETYPQKSRPIPALPMHDIVDRYSGLLRSILDNLPLTADEINRMIMPVISRLSLCTLWSLLQSVCCMPPMKFLIKTGLPSTDTATSRAGSVLQPSSCSSTMSAKCATLS